MPRAVILDANLAVLLVVGAVDPLYIRAHKRLSAFRSQDYDILVRYLERFDGLILLPNVLTETSNLLRYATEPLRSLYADMLAALIRQHGERYEPSAGAIKRAEYRRLGLTDSALLESAVTGGNLLTADFALYLAAAGAGLSATSFTHLREAAYGL